MFGKRRWAVLERNPRGFLLLLRLVQDGGHNGLVQKAVMAANP